MVYFDNASTTPLCESARQVIVNNLDKFWNPSSAYEPAIKLRSEVEGAREKIAELIGAKSADKIYFTSGASEANSWVMNGTDVKNILCSTIEHSSILNNPRIQPAIMTNYDGIVRVNWCDDIYLSNTLTSIMHVNNELGTIQPINHLAKSVHDKGGLFHTDATQSIPHMCINVEDLDVDMMSFSGHKFNAPKGIGVLYVKQGVEINPLIYGTQESGKRGGTTNALGILAMTAALEDTVKNLDEINEKTTILAEKLRESILNIPGVYNNVKAAKKCLIPGVINIRVDGVNGTDLVAACNAYKIYLGTGSACHAGDTEPSHVLKMIGLTDEQALSSVRISLGRYNTMDEVNYFIDIFPKIIKMLRGW